MPPLHILAVGALIRKGDTYLLVKSPRRGWEFPGGQVENGENLIGALKREIREESGISITHPQLAGIYSNISSDPTRLMMDFIAEYADGEVRTSEESLEVGWFSEGEIREKVTHPAYTYRLRHLLNNDGKILHASYHTQPIFEVVFEQFLHTIET